MAAPLTMCLQPIGAISKIRFAKPSSSRARHYGLNSGRDATLTQGKVQRLLAKLKQSGLIGAADTVEKSMANRKSAENKSRRSRVVLITGGLGLRIKVQSR